MALSKSVCYAAMISSYLWLNRTSIRRNCRKLKQGSIKQMLLKLIAKTYEPVRHHWFYTTVVEDHVVWQPFSLIDSAALEEAFPSASSETVVATDGGRHDVNILQRKRCPVYWEAPLAEVRRCSWFYNRNSFGNFVPYEEDIAAILENEYHKSFETRNWHQKITLPNGDCVTFRGPDNLILYPQGIDQPKLLSLYYTLSRGISDFDIDNGESPNMDHLLFIVHGVGAACDLKFRSITEVVDKFRTMIPELIESHYHSAFDNKIINRIEILPISWHGSLHCVDTGIDRNIKNITLSSIPFIRAFTNNTLLDVLLYNSPIYCQSIIHTVGTEMNRLFDLFKRRNPSFQGGVSVAGHSLGSLILFDLLCHQHPIINTKGNKDASSFEEEKTNRLGQRMSSIMSQARTQQPELHYPELLFQPSALFALGSPIGIYVTVRGVDRLGENFALPTCPHFLNIFHPTDPVACRFEPLINSELAKLQPVVIPHHRGCKRMGSITEDEPYHNLDNSERFLGVLNGGRRIDYVLQESLLDFLNEYIFAFTSHFCYWESRDTMLVILKEIYSSTGVTSDEEFMRISV